MCSGHMEGLELGIISRSAGHLDCLNCIKHNCTTHSSSSESYLTSCTSLNYMAKFEQNTAVHIQSRGVGNSRNIKMVVDLGVRPQLIPPQPPPSICNASKHTDTHTHTHTHRHIHKHTNTQTHIHKHTYTNTQTHICTYAREPFLGHMRPI